MVKINLFDQTLKIIGRNYADSLLRLALPGVRARLLGTLENVELSLPVRPVDFLHRIECEGQEHILHIEFQLEHEADFPRRMHSYHGALSEQFKIPVVPWPYTSALVCRNCRVSMSFAWGNRWFTALPIL